MFTFKIDLSNDEKDKIVDAGCVTDNVSTLITPNIRLDYNSSLIDLKDSKHAKLILSLKYDENLFVNSSYAMSGEIIDLKNRKDYDILNVSFGGLRGEFKLTHSHPHPHHEENLLPPSPPLPPLLTQDNASTQKIYLYIS